MALIVDKHRPRSLDALTYHEALSDRLRSLARSGDFPHLLIYGPSGAGKKTRIVATLKELYGPGVEKIKIDARVFQTSSNRKLEFNIVASVYHLEITPSDVGNYDRVVIQDLLKEVAQTQQVDQSARQRFKVVVINEADHLSRDAQAALRRTMEKYSPNLRLILLANSTANIIAPIRSRTLLVRVAAPTEEEICTVLASSAKREGWAVSQKLHQRIAKESGRNLRRAMLMLETVHAQNEKVEDTTAIPPPDWEALIGQIAKEIMDEHTPARILLVRAKFYDLLTHCIPPTTILKTLTFKLIPLIDDALKVEVIQWSAFYEHRIKMGNPERNKVFIVAYISPLNIISRLLSRSSRALIFLGPQRSLTLSSSACISRLCAVILAVPVASMTKVLVVLYSRASTVTLQRLGSAARFSRISRTSASVTSRDVVGLTAGRESGDSVAASPVCGDDEE